MGRIAKEFDHIVNEFTRKMEAGQVTAEDVRRHRGDIEFLLKEGRREVRRLKQETAELSAKVGKRGGYQPRDHQCHDC